MSGLLDRQRVEDSATSGQFSDRRSRALQLALIFVLVGCTGGQAPGAGIIQIRNLTSSPVAVHITEPSSGSQTVGAPPWQPGARSLEFGTAPGNVLITVGGASVHGTPSSQVVVPASPKTWTSVIVQADGTVTFGVAELPQGPCAAEHQVAPPPGY